MGGAYSYNTLGGEPAWLTSSPVEPIFPGPADVTNLRYLHRPDSRDIDMYSFVVAPGQTGEFTAEVLAERQLNSSLLDSVLTLYKQNSDGSRTVISTNDDYFSEDAYIKLRLEPGTYFLGVTASGNRDINPEITDSGLNGTSEGAYRIRTSFRPLEASTITDVAGTPLDGDNNGLAGGLYNFWFQAAAPNGEQTTQRRTLLVDKQTGSSTGNGSRTNPFLTIQSAFNAAQPGDIVRLVANGGSDGNILTTSDNRAYEIGSGGLNNQSLSDGRTMEVPKGVTVMIDPGVLVKVGRTAIGVGSSTTSDDRSQAGLQVLGTPEMNVLFTSYTDESLGIDTDSLPTTPQPGDWGGLMFRNALDRAEGRLDAELEGRFVNYVSNADMRYGGGRVNIDGNNVVVTPIHMVLARPTIAFNKISRSAAAAISADSNSFEETTFTTYQYQSDASFTPDYTRIGPALYGNTVINNSINGLFVRVETVYGQPDASQKNTGRWDDRDIVHFLSDTLTIDGTPGGPFLEQTAPASGVINLATGGNVAGGVLVPSRSYRYRLTFVDTNGNESIPSAPTLSFTVPAG
ncbi:MAG: hypothetical protein KGQ60_16820, partial [Planctomycetes bacterium]|nr:hypothetical protein [Planctomycetota bacterium]